MLLLSCFWTQAYKRLSDESPFELFHFNIHIAAWFGFFLGHNFQGFTFYQLGEVRTYRGGWVRTVYLWCWERMASLPTASNFHLDKEGVSCSQVLTSDTGKELLFIDLWFWSGWCTLFYSYMFTYGSLLSLCRLRRCLWYMLAAAMGPSSSLGDWDTWYFLVS